MSISGKYLTAELGSTTLSLVSEWGADEDSQMLGRTTGADEGYRNEDAGIQSCDVTVKGYMDIASGEYAQIEAGTVLTNLKLYRDSSDSLPAYSFPSAIVAKSHQGGAVEGKIEWNATIHNKGSYTYNDP